MPKLEGVARNAKTGATKFVTISIVAAERVVIDGVGAAACSKGCRVEPDGWCGHGWPSKLLAVGVI